MSRTLADLRSNDTFPESSSRQPFLPENHWLMTKEVDMEGITAVIAEEEMLQQEKSYEDDEADSDTESVVEATSNRPPTNRRILNTQKRLERDLRRRHL